MNLAVFKKVVRASHGDRCFYCGAVAESVDRIIPGKRSGKYTVNNVVVACHSCNSAKSCNELPEETLKEARIFAFILAPVVEMAYQAAVSGYNGGVRRIRGKPLPLGSKADDFRVANLVANRLSKSQIWVINNFPSSGKAKFGQITYARGPNRLVIESLISKGILRILGDGHIKTDIIEITDHGNRVRKILCLI